MRAHLSAPHGKRAGRDGKHTPRPRSHRFCRSLCGHTSSPWFLDVDKVTSVLYVVVVYLRSNLPQARIFWKSRSRYVRALAPAEREAYFGGVPFLSPTKVSCFATSSCRYSVFHPVHFVPYSLKTCFAQHLAYSIAE
jgi:hypothetical protein